MKHLGWAMMFFPAMLLIDELGKTNDPEKDIIFWRLFLILLSGVIAFRATKADNCTAAAQALFFSAALTQWLQE